MPEAEAATESERRRENADKASKVIEEFYGLKTEVARWSEDINPPAVSLRLLTPTGQSVVEFCLWFDREGYVIPEKIQVGKSRITGLDELQILIRKLAPKWHLFHHSRRK